MLLYYIRHGDPIYNPDCITPLGKRQAEAVAKRLAVYGIDEIYSSPSTRAYETAVPLSEIVKKEIVKIDFLNEACAWEYFAVPDLKGNRKWIYEQDDMRPKLVSEEVSKLGYEWYKASAFEQFNFEEGVKFFNKKTDEFMLSLGYEHNRTAHTYKAVKKNDKRIAVFAHAGVSRPFITSIFDMPYPAFAAHFLMSHTGITVIKFDDFGENIVPRLLTYSNDSHLYKDGLPTYHCNETPI